jgi:hypothetical protein
LYKSGKLSEDKYQKLLEINFPFEVLKKKKRKEEIKRVKRVTSKRKRSDTWDNNYDSFQKGEKSRVVYNWINYNRKQFQEGKLQKDKFRKLKEIDFPFEALRRRHGARKDRATQVPEATHQKDYWDSRYEMWKDGDTQSKFALQWKQRCLKQFAEGKLPEHRVEKLREVGIL